MSSTADQPPIQWTPDREAAAQAVVMSASPYRFVDSTAYRQPDAERLLFEDAPILPRIDASWYLRAKESGQQRAEPGATVVLTAGEEAVLFHQFNFARFQIWTLQQQVQSSGRSRARPADARKIGRWLHVESDRRQMIAEANLPLVLSTLKRMRHGERHRPDLIGAGNVGLVRAIDLFDVGRGYKFSTYAFRAVMQTMYRFSHPTKRSGPTPMLSMDDGLDGAMRFDACFRHVDGQRTQIDLEELRFVINTNAANLTDQERTVIELKFLQGAHVKPPNLKTAGELLELSRQRVQQVEANALAKLRSVLQARLDARPEVLEPESDDDFPSPAEFDYPQMTEFPPIADRHMTPEIRKVRELLLTSYIENGWRHDEIWARRGHASISGRDVGGIPATSIRDFLIALIRKHHPKLSDRQLARALGWTPESSGDLEAMRKRGKPLIAKGPHLAMVWPAPDASITHRNPHP